MCNRGGQTEPSGTSNQRVDHRPYKHQLFALRTRRRVFMNAQTVTVARLARWLFQGMTERAVFLKTRKSFLKDIRLTLSTHSQALAKCYNNNNTNCFDARIEQRVLLLVRWCDLNCVDGAANRK